MTTRIGPDSSPTTAVRQIEVGPFEKVELRDTANWVDLVAGPGERASLSVEGPPELLERVEARIADRILRITLGGGIGDRVRDMFTTSLTRRQLLYRLSAPRLLEIRVAGLVRTDVAAFGVDAPAVIRLEPKAPLAPVAPRPPIPPEPPHG